MTNLSRIPRRLAALLVVCGALVAYSPTAAHMVLPLTIERIHPVSDAGTTLMVAREAARTAGDTDRFKIKADVWLNNTGGSDLEVDSVTTAFPGSGIGSNSIPPTSQQIIPAGGEGRVRVFDGITRALTLPLPPTLQVTIGFVGTSESFVFTIPLEIYQNATPAGSHIFPAKKEDLSAGEYWSYGDRHVDNFSTVRDRYAYDMGVVRWDGAFWNDKGVDGNGNTLPGTSNSDFLVFGKPLYAVADGQVVVCVRGVAENPVGVLGSGGGNELWIQHGEEVVRYSHFKDGSLSSTLCPFNDGGGHNVEAMNILVTKGQQLGLAGNTGQSSGPHLHISVHRRPDTTVPLETSFELADSRPLGWHNIRIASHPTSIQSLGGSPSFHSSHGPILPSNTLIDPNACGLDIPPSGGIEIARHGISEGCYQDVFNLITAEGYRPVFVDGYDVDGDVFFNAIFRPSSVAWVASHGLDGDAYQELFTELTEDGYRLHHIDSYRSGGQILYAPIFEQRSGAPWTAYHGLTTAEHLATVESLRDAGYVPVRVSGVDPTGSAGTFWAALFEQVDVESWQIVDVPTAQYQDAFDAEVALDRLPTTIHGYNNLLGARITAVFVDPIGGAWSAAHGLDSDEYDAAHDAAFAAGKLLRAVGGYEEVGHRFAAVWRSLLNTSVTSGPPALTNSTSASLTFTSNDPWARFECRLNGASFSSCTSPRNYSSLSDGTHTFQTRAIDRDSLRDPTPAVRTWVVDATPPTIDITRPVPGFTYTDDTPSPRDDGEIMVIGSVTVQAVATDALSGVASVAFSVNNTPVPPGNVTFDAATSTWSFTFTATITGKNAYVIGAVATDLAGNSASDSISLVGVKIGKS